MMNKAGHPKAHGKYTNAESGEWTWLSSANACAGRPNVHSTYRLNGPKDNVRIEQEEYTHALCFMFMSIYYFRILVHRRFVSLLQTIHPPRVAQSSSREGPAR